VCCQGDDKAHDALRLKVFPRIIQEYKDEFERLEEEIKRDPEPFYGWEASFGGCLLGIRDLGVMPSEIEGFKEFVEWHLEEIKRMTDDILRSLIDEWREEGDFGDEAAGEEEAAPQEAPQVPALEAPQEVAPQDEAPPSWQHLVQQREFALGELVYPILFVEQQDEIERLKELINRIVSGQDVVGQDDEFDIPEGALDKLGDELEEDNYDCSHIRPSDGFYRTLYIFEREPRSSDEWREEESQED